MPHLEQESPQNSRTRLLEAAIFCFAEKGFDATGIREIAQRAQANSALVQYHFGGKDGLYSATLKYIFDGHPNLTPAAPDSADPAEARAQAIRGITELIDHLVGELLECCGKTPLDQASHLLVTREMQAPHSEAIPLVMDHIRPYIDHLDRCLQVLRPDLDRLARLDMTGSVFGPIFHLHNNMAMIRILREDPGYPHAEDLPGLAAHFTRFCLLGIGVPEAIANQGV